MARKPGKKMKPKRQKQGKPKTPKITDDDLMLACEQLYDNNWAEFEKDMRRGAQGKPCVFKFPGATPAQIASRIAKLQGRR